MDRNAIDLPSAGVIAVNAFFWTDWALRPKIYIINLGEKLSWYLHLGKIQNKSLKWKFGLHNFNQWLSNEFRDALIARAFQRN